MQTQRPAAIRFIFITLLIDVMGLGIIIPVMPKLIESLMGGTLSEAARYAGWLTFSYAIMQFICAPIIGNLSDQYGRRPILLLSLLGFGIDYIFLALAPSLAWLFVGRMIAGFTGASITTASAYIADISSPEKRAQNFGLIGAAFGLGFILGPLLGGLLAGWGVRMPFFASAALCLMNALYGYFILPESLAVENRRKFSWKRANPLGSFFQLTKYPSISALIASLILIYIAVHAVQSNWNFYTMYKFGWSEQLIGISLAFVGLLVGGVQGGLIRIILPKIGHEKGVWIGLLFYSIGFMGFAWATESWMMFAFLLPYAMGGIAGPSIQGIISNQVPPSEQGALQGGLTSLMSATAIIGPLLMAQLFAYFTSPAAPFQFPGAPMLLGGILTLISAGLAIRGFKRKG